METETTKPNKTKVILYWVFTGLLALGMFAGGIAQLVRAKPNVEGMVHLGYPLYFMPLLGIWKILGAIVLVIPGFKLAKEWAYAGFFFAMTGAFYSHMVSGDTIQQSAGSLMFSIFTVVSWYLRPANRRIQAI